MRILFFFLFFNALLPLVSTAQVNPLIEAQAREELRKRGLDEEEVRARLLQKGIDIDNISPEQLPQLQPVIEETLNELEQEKLKKTKEATQAEEPVTKPAIQEVFPENVEPTPAKAVQDAERKAVEDTQQSFKEINTAVKEGASVKEALSEELSEQAIGERPPATVYGQDLFRNQSLKLYRNVRDIKPPDSYVLGVGDAISVTIWGVSQADLTFEINNAGYIKPTGMPRIFLKGITYGKAKDLLRSRFSQFYVFQPEQFALTINSARTITVNIFGEVLNYGSFTISAINTAFNALVAAGGPSDIGTLRNIKLLRKGKEKRMDVYEFLFDPTVQYDFFLENNDYLFVPTAERTVTIQGAVKRPFRYELIEGEQLLKLIEYAGGLQDNAYKKNIQVKRLEEDREVLIDVNLNELLTSGKDFELKSSDVVSIRTIPTIFENFAEIQGAVELPGSYEITDNMRVLDLVGKGLLKKEARTDIAFLLRTNPNKTFRLIKLNLDSLELNPENEDNILLQAKDKLTIYSQERFTDKATISVNGAVRAPMEHPFDPTQTIRVQDAILLAGGLQQDAARYGYIKRTDMTNPKLKQYLRVDLKNALQNPESKDNLVLQPSDALQVFTRSRFTDAASVEVSGSVRSPGTFDFDENLRISDVIYLSGGLTQDVARYGYIKRTDMTNPKLKQYLRVDLKNALQNPESKDNLVLQPSDVLQVFTRGRFTDAASVEVSGSVRSPGTFDFDENLRISDVIYLSGGLTKDATDFGYIVRTDLTNMKLKEYLRVNLAKALANPESGDNLFLFPLDHLEVMSKTAFSDVSSVEVAGAVRHPGTFQYGANLSIRDLLTMAGGLKMEAASNRIDIFRLVIKDNQPTQTVVATIKVDKDLNPIGGQDFHPQPFDQIVVRTVPEFEKQQNVTIQGEVKYPGIYALTAKNEKLLSVVKRAGGITTESFPEGATLFRKEGEAGYVITRLDKVLKNRNSHLNYILKPGDIITVPKSKDLVTINMGATLAAELYPEKLVSGGKINVAYQNIRRANWYVKEYAGGLNKKARARKSLITVEHPNGEIKRTKNFLLFRATPKVRKGSVVSVGTKPVNVKQEKQKRERKPVDWEKIIANTMAQATAVLTLVLLLQQLN